MKRPIRWKPLLLSLVIPQAVGGLSALLTRRGMEQFLRLRQPPLSPPEWLFPVVWTLLFLLMGIACYRVAVSGSGAARGALWIYALQLVFNFFWTLIFFNLGAWLFAFFWLLALWALIWLCHRRFAAIDKAAGALLLPYLLWVSFAGYLNLGIWLLNR